MTSRLLTLFTTATVALAGCGGGTDENEASAWSGVRDCLVESGVRSFDEIPPTGPYMPPRLNNVTSWPRARAQGTSARRRNFVPPFGENPLLRAEAL